MVSHLERVTDLGVHKAYLRLMHAVTVDLSYGNPSTCAVAGTYIGLWLLYAKTNSSIKLYQLSVQEGAYTICELFTMYTPRFEPSYNGWLISGVHGTV